MILGDLPTQRRTQQTPPPNKRGAQFRLIALIVGVVLAFFPVAQRLYVLQILQQTQFIQDIKDTSTRTRFAPATRGLIYDRDGVALVRNTPAYQIAILPIRQIQKDNAIERRIERNAIYNQLAKMIDQPGVTAGDIFTKVWKAVVLDNVPYEPVIVAENVPREKALTIAEQAYLMPGVLVQQSGSRVYPYKELMSHILGYTSKIPPDQEATYPTELYNIDTDRIGFTGVEKVSEADLRGKKGKTEEVRDASGEVVQIVGTPISPTNGNSVYLTIDLKLQKIISDALIPIMQVRNSPRGAVVALNPQTGEILGMVSVPGYDNNLWTKGAPTVAEYDVLRKDIHKPLFNHATQDTVPPGSTFKVITAISLLEEGYITPNTVINDPGSFELPDSQDKRKFYCWIGLRGSSHGNQRVSDALLNSCNTFFRKAVGGYTPENIEGMGPDLLAKWASLFGIGEENELKISYFTGVAPTEKYKARVYGERWFVGDSYNVAIGQGIVQATPIEMANVVATIANGGTLYQPQIIKEVRDPEGKIIQGFQPKVIRQMPIQPETLALVQQSMLNVVNNGTAVQSKIEGFEYAGKTGTAEFCDDVALALKICYNGIEVQPTHAWFIAYAPAENPTLALAIYVWNGGQGSGVAAPIAQRIINQYFELKVPEDKLMKVKPTGSDSE